MNDFIFGLFFFVPFISLGLYFRSKYIANDERFVRSVATYRKDLYVYSLYDIPKEFSLDRKLKKVINSFRNKGYRIQICLGLILAPWLLFSGYLYNFLRDALFFVVGAT